MKPSFLINTLSGGGAEKQLSILLEHLDYEKVYTLEKTDVKAKNLVELSNHTNKTHPLIKLLYLKKYANELAKQISSDETIISFMTRANAVNIYSLTKSKHKAIISERTNPIKEFAGFKFHLYLGILKKTYEKANLIITNSLGVKEELIKSFRVNPEKIKVIPNHLDIKKINEMAKEPLNDYEKIFQFPTIITAGRLTHQKNHWRLIKIFSYIKRNIPDIKLIILGNGELKKYLYDISLALNLKTFCWEKDILTQDYDVYFLGRVENPYKFFAKAKLFILTSLWESLPNVLLEAMALKLPCISANCKYGPLEIFSINPNLSEYNSNKIMEKDFGILLPCLSPKKIYSNEKPDEIEKIWIDFIISLLKDEKKLSFYSQVAEIRATDYSITKTLPLWKKLTEEI